MKAQHVCSLAYLLLGLVMCCMMFQLSCSLSLILNIFDLKEAKKLKNTYNICIFIVGLMCIACGVYEYNLDRRWHEEHLIFEALGLVVLCLIYFSTIVELLRKLRIFILHTAKIEACFIRIQFLIESSKIPVQFEFHLCLIRIRFEILFECYLSSFRIQFVSDSNPFLDK